MLYSSIYLGLLYWTHKCYIVFSVEVLHTFLVKFIPKNFIFWCYCECKLKKLFFKLLLVYRSTVDFYTFILYIAIMVNLLFSSSNYFADFLGFLCKQLLSMNTHNITYYFPFCMLFISLPAEECWLTVVRVDIPCLALHLGGKHSVVHY